MKIAIYSPYLPKHFGGGEKYILDVARVLSQRHQVFVILPQDQAVDTQAVRAQYESFLGCSLQQVEFVLGPVGHSASFLTKLTWTAQYDCMYYLTDGSFFFSLAKRNIAHFQFPFMNGPSGLMARFKLANWSIKNANSEFTKSVIEKFWPTKIQVVHHPMINVGVNDPAGFSLNHNKEKVILSVGRFFKQLHSKRQDVLVRLFKQFIHEYPQLAKEWKLVLIGSVEDTVYAQAVAQQAHGLPIEIYHQATRAELLNWYDRSSIYWHAAGYEIDPQVTPEKVEHFGISTVEAMAYGCVPIVHGKGGQLEILGEPLKDLAWQTDQEALALTHQLLIGDKSIETLRKVSLRRAQLFNETVFAQKLWQMVG